jgi:hypothetical protein
VTNVPSLAPGKYLQASMTAFYLVATDTITSVETQSFSGYRGGFLSDFARWSGYPSIAAMSSNPGIDAMGHNRTHAMGRHSIIPPRGRAARTTPLVDSQIRSGENSHSTRTSSLTFGNSLDRTS